MSTCKDLGNMGKYIQSHIYIYIYTNTTKHMNIESNTVEFWWVLLYKEPVDLLGFGLTTLQSD